MLKRLWTNWHVVNLVASYALRNLAFSPGGYATLSLSLIITLLMTRNTFGVTTTGYLTVLSEPFLSALIATCLLCGLFMALVAGLSVVREREMGTLETIFYGPVSHLDYLLGKYSAYLIGYIVLIAAFLIFCAIIGWLTNLTISALLFYIAILSAAMGMGLIGLGLFIATIMRTVRGTLLLFVGLMLAALTLEVGRVILTSIISSRTFVGLIILRDTVTHLDSLIMWFTPASYLFRGADAALRQNWSEWLGYIAVALLYACITLSLSTALLRKRGVLR